MSPRRASCSVSPRDTGRVAGAAFAGAGVAGEIRSAAVLLPRATSSPEYENAFDFELRALGQSCDLVGRARRVRRLEVGRHDLVHLREIAEIGEQNRQLDNVV